MRLSRDSGGNDKRRRGDQTKRMMRPVELAWQSTVINRRQDRPLDPAQECYVRSGPGAYINGRGCDDENKNIVDCTDGESRYDCIITDVDVGTGRKRLRRRVGGEAAAEVMGRRAWLSPGSGSSVAISERGLRIAAAPGTGDEHVLT